MTGLTGLGKAKPEETTEESKQAAENRANEERSARETLTKSDAQQEVDPIAEGVKTVLAENAAANAGGVHESDEAIFSSHPIQNFHLGRFVFENTLLRLSGKDVGEFKELLEKLPLYERNNIREISLAAVDSIVAGRSAAAQQGTADSAAGRSALEAMLATTPKVGTKPIEEMGKPAIGHAAIPGDQNEEVVIDTDPANASQG